ncbi:hypothetical protein Acr_07g0016330 [Actinidia rufa]|uniref:Uncharacterized protein n=1 Tax=Actinidia rufa TaxID=165716 RepID=A0A7J0F0N9_9ERIC|nr:hypothetical protein Acr_07g0016330 [Actinidia rufa]
MINRKYDISAICIKLNVEDNDKIEESEDEDDRGAAQEADDEEEEVDGTGRGGGAQDKEAAQDMEEGSDRSEEELAEATAGAEAAEMERDATESGTEIGRGTSGQAAEPAARAAVGGKDPPRTAVEVVVAEASCTGEAVDIPSAVSALLCVLASLVRAACCAIRLLPRRKRGASDILDG